MKIMKTLYTLILVLCSSLLLKADPIILTLTDGTIVTNGTYVAYGAPNPPQGNIEVDVHVENTTDTTINLKVRRRNINVDPMTSNYFCWFQCYAPATNVDPGTNNIAINSGETNNTDFHAYYVPGGFNGVSKIRYTFFNINPGHAADSSYVEITFNTQLPTQPILLQELGSNFVTNSEVFLSVPIDTNNAQQNDVVYPLSITNNTNVIKQILVKKRELSIVPGSENFFSWRSTFNPTVMVDTGGYIMLPNTTINDEFKAIYRSNGNLGESVIQYVVFNKFDLTDSSFVNVHFNALFSSISKPNDVIIKMQLAPNPSTNFTNLNYSLPNNSDLYTLKVINLLGAEVASYELPKAQTRQIIDTHNFENGVYFCQITSNNKTIKTIKLVVSK
jgi:hypothetical protein